MIKKSVLLTALAIAGFAVTSLAQTVPNYVPTNGLVAWWPFNGNAIDESVNTNDGTVNGATLTADRFGNSNSAYNFNVFNWTFGSGGDYIYVPFASTFNSSNITVSVWFLKDSNYITNQSRLSIIKRYEGGYSNPNGQSWGIYVKKNGDSIASFILPPNTTNSYASFLDDTGPKVQSNQWHNAAFTFNGNVMLTYYDGQLISSSPSNGMLLNANGNSGISIGMSIQANGHWDPYNGKIDDVGIWNRALTQQEINTLYNTNLCFQTITVTDTLLINTNITGFNPVTYQNTIKIWPNPTNDHITIDNGNLANLTGHQIKISNALGQQVFQSAITQQQFYVDMSTWGGNGIYFVNLINAQGVTIETRKIVLQ